VATSKRPRGRPPGKSDTRESILDAARAAFGAHGYDRTTIRSIASDAGVDPALVHHYFGTKADVFAAAVQYPASPSDVVARLTAAGPQGMGAALASFLIQLAEDPARRASVLALVRSAVVQDEAAGMLREFISRVVLGAVAPQLPYPEQEARLRLELAVSHLIGLVLVRHVVKLEPLASAPAADVIDRIAPVIQQYFDAAEPQSRA
jgi:AcrR family transcriptional regulator